MKTKEQLIISLVLKDLGIDVPDQELAHKISSAAVLVEAMIAGGHEAVRGLEPAKPNLTAWNGLRDTYKS
jgi:hypothetical protein